jgi:polyhydroxyalkanoate synthase
MTQQYFQPVMPDLSAVFAPMLQPAAVPDGVMLSPERVTAIQHTFTEEWKRLCETAARGQLPPVTDRRFSAPAWADSQPHLFMAHAYLHTANAMRELADSVEASPHVRQCIRFAVDQWLDATAPSNFLAFNPDAQRTLVESKGSSLQAGIANMLADMQRGRITQTDETSFRVGENIATTPGSVVFENRLLQLIQYKPATPKVHVRPLLVVPPCINKFYVLDLQANNSFVRHAVNAGFTVFIVSWRNPLPSDTDGILEATWDDYLDEGVLEAVRVAREISAQPQINALGFCVGGTLLAAALAVARARGEDPVASMTLLTTLLDFADTGILDVFIDENHVRLREQQLGRGGLLTAAELASTFSFLRPNELVWNYVVGNYLKGEKPQPFDLLYWNADSTNLPGPLFAWYLRNMYLENKLRRPDCLVACGQPIDLGRLDMPTYIYGSRDDHIVPWHSAYASTGLLGGERRFVLGASGHIAGVVNPPAKKKRSHWLLETQDGAFPDTADAWLASATEHPGSWWDDWTTWLTNYGGEKKKAPTKEGNAAYPVIEPAPGRYVQVRAI